MTEEHIHHGKLISLAMVVLLSLGVRSDCTFTQEFDGTLCIGNYTCVETVGDLASEINHWTCRKTQISFSGYRRTQTNDYVLNIYIENSEEHIVMANILEYLSHVITMSIHNSISMSIPDQFFESTKMTKLDVSHNDIYRFDLPRIHLLDKLNVLNASFNIISRLQEEDYKKSSTLSTLDLSHNRIRAIPDNYFKKFPNLLNLNMSHNEIESFSILTFEGLAELETLRLSNNKIGNMGMYFARFQNLRELYLDHNELTAIEEISVKMMSKLIKLDMSYNKIISIDELCFQNMMGLEILQLNDNIIKSISKSMFINNNNLQILELSDNNITRIESYSFQGKYITQLSLHNNSITGLIDRSIMVGVVKVDNLDFSSNNITSLGPDLLVESRLKLRSLNFSSNCISNIHENTFRSLGFLTSLDLSNNQLQSLHFDFSDLTSLTVFKAENNLIEKITKDTFRTLRSLIEIDLSKNHITDIDVFSLKDLNNLQTLDLSNNPLSSLLAQYTFSGLFSTSHLNLTRTEVTTIEDGAFNGMANLIFLNVSYSDLQILNYKSFNNTGSIWTLDLSHNRLETFLVNNSNLRYLVELYLNDNQISIVSNQTFAALIRLEQVNLSNNKILKIASGALKGLRSLFNLALSSNTDMILDSVIFSNLSLAEVSIHNVWKPFNFGNAVNVSILNLDLSSSNITDIGAIQLVKLMKVEKLLLNSNKIPILDKKSFQNLSDLIFLDLSDNLISLIKPGSFASITHIEVLNLSNNILQTLQFGVFDGLVKLSVLNLSSNSLHGFSGNLFHNGHAISIISLDNNMIDVLDFDEIYAAGIQKITIGNNLISCDYLAKAKKNALDGLNVDAEIYELHSENVDGISCRGLKVDKKQQNQSTNIIDGAQTPHLSYLDSEMIVSKLGDLKSVLYFESSCLLIIVVLLLVVASFVYFKLQNKLVRSYSLNSRRHLTASAMEMEL